MVLPPPRPGRLVGAALLVLLAFFSPALWADRVAILATDREAAEARVEVALEAKLELFASYFIIGHDPLSLASLSLLRDASRRGVEVRLLVDAQWNQIPDALQDHLVDEGVEIREYHPFRLDRLSWIFKRMHDKLLIADRRQLISGGRNIESTYFGFGHQIDRRNYLDLDLWVEGGAAAEARSYYEDLWDSRHVRAIRSRSTPAERAAAGATLEPHKKWLDAEIALARTDPDRPMLRFFEAEKIEFLHDPVGKTGNAPGVGHALLALLDEAEHTAVIESPYLIPSRAFRAGLRRVLGRGVEVRILTNSIQATDNLWAQAGYVGKKKGLVKDGLDLWEYSGPECLHAKAGVIDGRTVIVGSFNLDPRSEFLNTEVALVVRDPAVAERLLEIMRERHPRSIRIDHRGWPEGANEPFPGVPRGKVFRLRLLQLLAPFIERQL